MPRRARTAICFYMIGEMSSLERYLSEGGYRICAITARSIPRRRCVAELNVQLLAVCREDERRVIAGRGGAVAPGNRYAVRRESPASAATTLVGGVYGLGMPRQSAPRFHFGCLRPCGRRAVPSGRIDQPGTTH